MLQRLSPALPGSGERSGVLPPSCKVEMLFAHLKRILKLNRLRSQSVLARS
jgi:hypothetical protein